MSAHCVTDNAHFRSNSWLFDFNNGSGLFWGRWFLLGGCGVTVYADLFVFDPLFVCTARTYNCAHVKDPISISRKRVGLRAGGMETRKHCTQGEKQLARAFYIWLLVFLVEISPNVPFINWDKKGI